jgi:hypothetical protein
LGVTGGSDASAPCIGAESTWHDKRDFSYFRETGLVLPRKGAVTKFLRRLAMSRSQRARDIAAAPDRTVLCGQIFPEVAARGGNILFVGVRAYTTGYAEQLESRGGICFTVDFDPAAAKFGVVGRHATGCITDIARHFPDTMFDTIVMTGVFGFGVNRASHQLAALEACAKRLKTSGMLVLGWNDRRVAEDVLAEAAARWFDFRPFGVLPPRIWVTGYDHNFAFLKNSGRRAQARRGTRLSVAGLLAWASPNVPELGAITAVL